MKRAFILVMDSFGIGASQDAPAYGDEGADTFGNIARQCYEGKADQKDLRKGPLKLPNLSRLGLQAASLASTGHPVPVLDDEHPITAAYGYAVEQSFGKDTPSGHWEMAGLPVKYDWGFFRQTIRVFL